MKVTRNHLTIGFLAIVAVLAVFALAGVPLVPTDALAGLGMLPMAMSGEIDMKEIKTLLDKQGEALSTWQSKQDDKLKALQDNMLELAKKAGRPNLGGLSGAAGGSAEVKGFLSYVRSGDTAGVIQSKAASSGSGPDGGYLVPEELDGMLTKYLRAASPMRQLARVVGVSSSTFTIPFSTLGTGATWVGETASRPATATPGFASIDIPARTVYANPAITQNLLDDNAFDLENWLIQELTDAFGDAEGAAFVTGDGVNSPRGLFTYDVSATADATRPVGEFQYVPTGASGDFASSNPGDALISLVHAVRPQYRANASWLIGGEALEAIRKMKDGSGAFYLWQPSQVAGEPSTLLGYPVYEDENVPAIAAGSLSVAFGDFSRAYVITDRSTSMLRDPFTNKPYVNFYTTKRVGGGRSGDRLRHRAHRRPAGQHRAQDAGHPGARGAARAR